jgi:hypothetical protein
MAAKESSVDIEAQWFDSDEPKLSLHLLVECKYRSRNKSVLFLPDPNELYPSATLGGTVCSFDFAVPYRIDLDAFVEIERSIDYVYKGIEISDEGAFEEQIWHGIQQLRYGVPVLLKKSLEFTLYSHIDDMVVLFFANILVTNAPIRLLREGCTLEDIDNSSRLEDISEERECVVIFSEYGPDFEDHFRNIFEGSVGAVARAANARRETLVSLGKPMDILNDPVGMFESFREAERYPTSRVSTQFFVVTLSGLDRLIGRIQDDCRAAYANRTVYPIS